MQSYKDDGSGYGQQGKGFPWGQDKQEFREDGKGFHQNLVTDKDYSEEGFFKKVERYAKTIGRPLLERAFCLYYAIQSPEMPLKEKGIVMGALAYLVLPIDLIPDFIPGAGYIDDAAALAAAYMMVKKYITPELEERARKKVSEYLD